MTRESILRQGFDVLRLENSLYRKAKREPYYEIDRQYNYDRGYHLNTICCNGIKIGEYHRDPLGQGWFGRAFYRGSSAKQRFATDSLAIGYIKRQYLATR